MLDWQAILWDPAVGSLRESLLTSIDTIQAAHAHTTQSLQPISQPHVTLLWSAEPANRSTQERLEEIEGKQVQVTVVALCWDAGLGLIALRVALDDTCAALCQNCHPHITVAKLPGVAAKQSNDMLARQADGDKSVVQVQLHSFMVTGVVQRQLSVESLATAAALGGSLPEGNPICKNGLAATGEAVDVWATYDGSIRFRKVARTVGALCCQVSEPLLHCKALPALRGKIWLTFHERPLSSESVRALEQLQKNMLQTLHLAVAYFPVSEFFLQRSVADMQDEITTQLPSRKAVEFALLMRAPVLLGYACLAQFVEAVHTGRRGTATCL